MAIDLRTARPAAVSAAQTRLARDRFHDGCEPMRCLPAEPEVALLGFAQAIPHRQAARRGPIRRLQDLFAAPAARGQGVGRALIEAVYALAREPGGARAYRQTRERKAAARRLCDRIARRSGFIVHRHDP